MTPDEAREKFGRRIQRCAGCYVAFLTKDLWWGDDGNYYCVGCQSDYAGVTVHFDDYADGFDFSQLPSLNE